MASPNLPAGRTAAIAAHTGEQRTFSHWNASKIKPVRYACSQDYAEHFRDLLFDAVRRRLRGIHRAAVLLSGGLDSSSIACVASRILTAEFLEACPLLTFTATSSHCRPDPDGDTVDEASFAREVITSYRIGARFFNYEDFLTEGEISPPIKRAMPIPIGMGVFTQMLRGAREAGVRMMMSGIGGDEILGANSNLYLLRYADLLVSGTINELTQDLAHAHKYYPWCHVFRLLWSHGCWPIVKSIFSRLLRGVDQRPSNLMFPQRQTYEELSTGTISDYGLETYNLLSGERGIEMCYPFLDLRVVEFCLGVPSSELSRH